MKEFFRRVLVVIAAFSSVVGVFISYDEGEIWGIVIGVVVGGAVWWISEGLNE